MKSKYDQYGKGADVIVGRTYVSVCPVTAILNFIAGKTDRPGAFFLLSSGVPTTKGWFTRHIRELLGAMGLPQTNMQAIVLGSVLPQLQP